MDKIEDSLNLLPMKQLTKKDEVLDMVPADQNFSDENTSQIDEDADSARTNIKDIIETGATALEELADVAQQSQHPRAYEVLATLMKNMVEANKDLLQLHKTKKEIKQTSGGGDTGGGNKTTNQVFVGSTDELLKLMQNDK
jgi:hypothetical protein